MERPSIKDNRCGEAIMNIFSHWKQKLFSLVLAVAIWIILKESIEPGSLDQLLSSLRLLK
ncbi:hypothetical protein [Candidatus Methylacidiphilum infernorum]|uniref:Uncharacterized protein n=1 Tax=Methylacidiphilum infernorum (isolate V4) TaxID=481448 RepID=B3DXZ8_METI4|nr:hypothetical protein [Candidatus Methylacidiphilum infernorum]ACD83950.1 Hypothetical protein Minf_1896 [Methylacidiphilum infernorum V4]